MPTQPADNGNRSGRIIGQQALRTVGRERARMSAQRIPQDVASDIMSE